MPSPCGGIIEKLYGEVGDIIHVGDPLVEFKTTKTKQPDSGSVVEKVEVGNRVVEESPMAASRQGVVGIKATPAVRALASRLNVDLSLIKPSGNNNTITADDVRRVSKLLQEVGEMIRLKGVRRAMAQTMSLANAEVVPVIIPLSNFGTFARGYANPIVVPPTVAILGLGKSVVSRSS